MHRLTLPLIVAIAFIGKTSPALAHVAADAAPHWHESDTWGLLSVIALVIVAVWFHRRRR